MQRVEAQACFVLHLRPYRDSSAIVELLSEHHGRLSVVARGLRGSGKSRQSWRGALQVFNLCQLGWQGRGELKTLVDSQLMTSTTLRGEALYCGFYLNEVLQRTLQRFDPHPKVFTAYRQCLAELAGLPDKQQQAIALRRFELALLDEMGYGLYLQHCYDTGESLQPDRHYCYIAEHGLRRARASDSQRLPGAVLLDLLAGDWQSPGVAAAARQLTQQVLTPLLGDKPLQSRRLFKQGRTS